MRGLVQLVTSLFEQRRFRKGDLLARQGTPATTMFYLQEGTCEIVHDLHAGDADEDFVEDSVSACLMWIRAAVHASSPSCKSQNTYIHVLLANVSLHVWQRDDSAHCFPIEAARLI